MARKKKNAQGAIVPTPARLVQTLTKAQSKLLDALIDDPTLSPGELCETAGVPAYTWRRALRSPAFAAALLDAQRGALDASRLSRTQAAIEKAHASPAFARLCFQIDGSIREAPSLVQQFNQQIVNMPISQLRKQFESGATVQIPNLNYSEVRGLHNTAIDKDYHEGEKAKGSPLAIGLSECPVSHDLHASKGIVALNNITPKCSEAMNTLDSEVVRSSIPKFEVGSGSEVRSTPKSEVGAVGRAFTVTREAPGGRKAAERDQDDLFDLL